MITSGKTVPGINFGPFFLDTAGRRLLRDGRRVSISPIELKLLEMLLRNRNRVLTADELRVLVWSDDPSTGVPPAGDANTLYVAVRKLRRSLGSYGKWIVNIPKVGYTVADEVEVDAGDERHVGEAGAGYPFVGRQRELKKLRDLLTKTRLVSLTGPPGIGKSRLASKFAEEIARNYPDGTYSINFVAVENEALAPKALSSALDLDELPDRSVIDVISEELKDKRALLVFDNCEQLIDACSKLAEQLLKAAPKIRIIATSREPLMLAGESVMSVPPLNVPGPEFSNGIVGPGEYDALDLFTALAKHHRSDFGAERKDLLLLGELCRQLEGIPLAIELAAAQVSAYTVGQIIEAMSDRFRLLRRRGGADVRHQTLEGAIDWSYSLLTEEERILLNRLSVFAGGWTSETAREICAGDGVNAENVIHLLADLVRRSLIQLTFDNEPHRYQILETIRMFAREQLRRSGEQERIYARHDRYFLDLAERCFEAGPKGDWLPRLDAEYDNVRSVLERSIRQDRDIETGLRMCGDLGKFWFNYGHLREARWWTRLALDADEGKFPEASARALRTAGFFFGQIAGSGEDPEVGKSFFERSLALWRDLGNEVEEAFTLCHYAFLLNRLGLVDEARSATHRSLELSTAAGDHANIARSVNNLALTLVDAGQVGESKPVFEMALAEARIAEDSYLEAVCLLNLGEAAVQIGELENADEYLGQSLELFKLISNRPLFARTLLLQGEVATRKNETKRALDLERTALKEFVEIEDNQGIASAFEAIALTHNQAGTNPTLFLTLNSAANKLRRSIKLHLAPARKNLLESLAKKAKASLGKTAAGSAVEIGKTMDIGDMIQVALTAT